MNRLLIIGAGGFGRETLDWLTTTPPAARDWDQVAGFLDDNLQALDGIDCSHSVLASTQAYVPQPNDRFLCTVGTPRVRLALCAALRARGAVFTTVIHHFATVSTRARLGSGCIVGPGASASNNTVVGDDSYLLANVIVGHDSRIGLACNLSPGAVVSGGCTIGDGTMIGTNASLLPSARVGDFAVVGAGSVVLRSVPAGATVMGVPAKQISGFAP